MNELYCLKKEDRVLETVSKWFVQNSINVILTQEVFLNKTYLVGSPWFYNKEQQQVFEGNYLSYNKGYFFTGKVADYHRLTYNSVQETTLYDCDHSRIDKFNITLNSWKKTGDYILILGSSDHATRYYTDCENSTEWILKTKNELKKYTDRKIFYRFKENRKKRNTDPLDIYLENAWAVITLQSLGSIESICKGVPVFNLAPCCCQPVSLQDISKIEEPYYPDNRWEWLKSLSYGQFNPEEIANGTALSLIKERYSLN